MRKTRPSIPKHKTGKGRRAKEPLDVRLTVRVRFGDAGDETLTMMDDRSVPMIDSVFKYRNLIFKNLSTLLIKAAAMQPRIARELMPLVGKLRPGRPRKT